MLVGSSISSYLRFRGVQKKRIITTVCDDDGDNSYFVERIEKENLIEAKKNLKRKPQGIVTYGDCLDEW